MPRQKKAVIGNDRELLAKVTVTPPTMGNIFKELVVRDLAEGSKLHTINAEKLEKISNKMEECNRAMRSFGRASSQFTSKTMNLTMMESGPYRMLHQCLTQIEQKRSALQTALFELRRNRLTLQELVRGPGHDVIETDIDKANRELTIDEMSAKISESTLYIEGAMKEIGIYQDAYDQIKKNNNIPDNWDEKDFEEAELGHHIRSVFRLGLRDMMEHGSLGFSTCEYCEQLGIHPLAALKFLKEYLTKVDANFTDIDKVPSIESWYSFLDNMVKAFSKEHQKAMARIGLDNLINEDFVYREQQGRT